jgi:leucyl/phenylalanyl-tRNA--protein transferase
VDGSCRNAGVPIEPPPTPWGFPSPTVADEAGVVGVGADLEPGTLLAAYRSGLFPMPIGRGPRIAWWSPDPRGVLPLDELRITRSLRQSNRRYEVRIDTAFEGVIQRCADPARDGGWISPDIIRAYTALHDLGWAHSVETFEDGQLVGGLYGVSIGGFFAGESMFHDARDASKVALLGLVDRLRHGGAMLLDVQWTTPHLTSLGAIDIPRHLYLDLLADAVALPVDPFSPFDPPHRSAGTTRDPLRS